MVPNPYGLYDDEVGTRTRWALREGLVLGGILLFWVALAVVLTVALLVVSVPFTLFRFGAPGLPVAALVWTAVGPLATMNAALYVLARVGVVLVDHYRGGEAPDHLLGGVSVPEPPADDRDEVPDDAA